MSPLRQEDQHTRITSQPSLAREDDPRSILRSVYRALHAKGYDPITQLAGYLVSGDPTYITSYNNARAMIARVERDEIIEELVRNYIVQFEE